MSTDAILVSAFIPVYNAENYVVDAITSILAQTYTNFELIIINDGSTDGSAEHVKQFNDPRIIFLDLPINRGVSYACNKALAIAKGTYLMRLDADDIALPKRMSTQVQLLESNPKLTVIGTQLEIFGNGKTTTKLPSKDSQIKAFFLAAAGNIANPSSMIRLEFFRAHKIQYQENLAMGEDLRFWVDAAFKGARFFNTANVLTKYRTHAEQASMTNSHNLVTDLHNIRFDLLRNWYPDTPLAQLNLCAKLLHAQGGSIDTTKTEIQEFIELTEVLKRFTKASSMGEDRATVNAILSNRAAFWKTHLD